MSLVFAFMSEKKRILLLSTAYLPLIGGSELALRNIADRLPDFSFDLITARVRRDLPAQEQIGNVTVFRVGSGWQMGRLFLPKNFLPLAIFWRGVRCLLAGHYDAIHAYQASQAAGAGWMLTWFFPRVPFMVTLQEGKDLARQPALVRFFRRLILRRADTCTVISEYLKRQVLAMCPEASVQVIPNGVDIQIFHDRSSGNALENARARLGLSSARNVIISISRLVKKNGLEYLVQSLKHLPEAKLVLVGAGDQENHLRTIADVIGVTDRVVFVGMVAPERLPEYLAVADVFVRPSLSEGLGTAFLEAMACGVPVVGSPVGGIPEFLTDGETGLFCIPTDPEDIAKKIERLCADTGLRSRIRERALTLVRERYDWKVIADQMRAVYNRIIAS